MKRIALLIACCMGTLASAQTSSPYDQTQIVAQWLMTANSPGMKANLWGAMKCVSVDQKLDDESGNLYFDDGNDVGSGTCNIYLYTARVDDTIAFLIDLEKKDKIPRGLRIGVAVYTNKAHSDWIYAVAFPPSLKKFDITY
jgi:hypothetical protein